MSSERDDENKFKYGSSRISVDEDFSGPSYKQLLDWSKDAESRTLALDIWARGNYIKYLMERRRDPDPTIIIPFQYLDELRCYYRRMAIMGLPAHFIYTGDLPQAMKCLCLHPGDKGYMIDAGGGWIAALGSTSRIRGRNWFPIMGCSRPMPEVFAEWLTTEAATDFARGHAFVSPAELIGMPRAYLSDGIEMAAEINESAPFLPQVTAAELMFNLELPYIDEMDHATFSKIMEDNDFRLERFRHALKKLVKSQSVTEASEVISELKDEVAQIQLSDNTFAFRKTISQFGGVFTTFGAGISAVGAAMGRGLASLDTIGPTIAGAATAGAVAAFVDIWKQCSERSLKRRENKFSIFWDLGVKKPGDLKRRRSLTKIRKFNKFEPILLNESFDCHWLCEPGSMQFLAVRRIS
jgi:hypothetical protein